MSSDRYSQMLNIKAAECRKAVDELNQLAADIGRCEQTITAVMTELNAVNQKFSGPRTTGDDVEYLTILLDCAKKKLEWEKKISSLRKRAPGILENMTKILSDPDFPPPPDAQVEMLRSLQTVQSALTRLQGAETPGPA